MREHLIVVAASAETAAITGFAVMRGIWMTFVEKGNAAHLGAASSLYAFMQLLGAVTLPHLMLQIGFTRGILVFLFLHALALCICACAVGTNLLAFYMCHAGAGFLSCTTDFLRQWGLLLSSTPEQQLKDFSLFQRSFLFGPMVGAGVSSLSLTSSQLWKQDVTRSMYTAGPDMISVRVVLTLLSLLIVVGGLILFLVPLPADRIDVRSYTYEDLMDALVQSNKRDQKQDEKGRENAGDTRHRRPALLGDVPSLHIEEPPRKLARERTAGGLLHATEDHQRGEVTYEEEYEGSMISVVTSGSGGEASRRSGRKKSKKRNEGIVNTSDHEKPSPCAPALFRVDPSVEALPPPSPNNAGDEVHRSITRARCASEPNRPATAAPHDHTSQRCRRKPQPRAGAQTPTHAPSFRGGNKDGMLPVRPSTATLAAPSLRKKEDMRSAPGKANGTNEAFCGDRHPAATGRLPQLPPREDLHPRDLCPRVPPVPMENDVFDLPACSTLPERSSPPASSRSEDEVGLRGAVVLGKGAFDPKETLVEVIGRSLPATQIKDLSEYSLSHPPSTAPALTLPNRVALPATVSMKRGRKPTQTSSTQENQTLKVSPNFSSSKPKDDCLKPSIAESDQLDKGYKETVATRAHDGGETRSSQDMDVRGEAGRSSTKGSAKNPKEDGSDCPDTCALSDIVPAILRPADKETRHENERPPTHDARRGSGAVNFDYFATFFSPSPTLEKVPGKTEQLSFIISSALRSKCRRNSGAGKPKAATLPHRNKSDACPTTYFRRKGPSLLTNLRITEYGGLKQAPLDFKVHDKNRRERAARCEGDWNLRLFYYGVGANANIVMASTEVIEKVAVLYVQRNMVSIPQLEFLPLKSYSRGMLTDATLRDSVAAVRESLANNKLPQELTLYTKTLRIWPLFFPIAVFHLMAFQNTMLTYIPLTAFGISHALAGEIFLGCVIIRLLPVLCAKLLFPRASMGHMVFYVCGFCLEVGVALGIGLVRDLEVFILLTIIGCAGFGMLCPAGVKVGTKMVPTYLHLQQFNCQLWPTHIVRIVSPLMLGALYYWTWAAPFVATAILLTIVLLATATTMILRPKAWGFSEGSPPGSQHVGTHQRSQSLASYNDALSGGEDRHGSATYAKTNCSPKPSEDGEAKHCLPPERAARVHQAIEELTKIGEKPAVLPGVIQDAEELPDLRVSGGLAPIVRRLSRAPHETHAAVPAS